MSGGYFNYSQNRINDVVEYLEYLLDDEEAQEHRDTYSDATLQKFKEAVDILRKAFVYTQRIDWLLSGDDGEETFHERLEEDLNQIEPDWVRVGDGTLHGAIDYWQDRAERAEAKIKEFESDEARQEKFYMTYCWVEPRSSDKAHLFYADANGNVTGVKLSGYAVVPAEKYAEYFDGKKKSELLALADSAHKFLETLGVGDEHKD